MSIILTSSKLLNDTLSSSALLLLLFVCLVLSLFSSSPLTSLLSVDEIELVSDDILNYEIEEQGPHIHRVNGILKQAGSVADYPLQSN